MDARIFIDAAALHGLTADVQHRSRTRKQKRGTARRCRQIGHVNVLELRLVPTDSGRDDVIDVASLQSRLIEACLQTGVRYLLEFKPGRLQRPGENFAVVINKNCLGVSRSDIDPGCYSHSTFSATLDASGFLIRSSANRDAPSAPM